MNGDIALINLLTPQRAEDPNVFLGRSHAYGAMGIYGGHFLGQALAAGLTTVDVPKLAHSLHAYFMRGGDPEVPILYTVDSLRDGRGSSTRSISAWQHDAEIFRMMASFKLPEDGDEHGQSSVPFRRCRSALQYQHLATMFPRRSRLSAASCGVEHRV
jgi:acyl-CoA thioesterase-2